MRRFLLAAALTLTALPGAALAQVNAAERARRAVTVDTASACQATCMQDMTRPGSNPAAAQACTIRCGAVAGFARQEARSQAVVTGRGSQPAILRASAPLETHGIIFAARTPSAAFGMVVGETDRMAAHRVAEDRCAAAGPGCRPIHSFTAACGAVAHGVKRSPWALVMTSDPSTFVVTTIGGGSGATPQAAEQEALADCRSRDPRAQCRIVASQCGRS
ncbi:MAG: DUF4189 domain-containing protein [Acetobacteraceae bacterium]|nr:DUF4189 domain-containing protein [Acetobacteraceae bacterium]